MITERDLEIVPKVKLGDIVFTYKGIGIVIGKRIPYKEDILYKVKLSDGSDIETNSVKVM